MPSKRGASLFDDEDDAGVGFSWILLCILLRAPHNNKSSQETKAPLEVIFFCNNLMSLLSLSRSLNLLGFSILELGLGFAWILSLALDSTGATYSFVSVKEFVCWVIVTVVFFLF